MLIFDGLFAFGEKELVFEILEKFTKLCSENGFSKYFNLLIGKKPRDQSIAGQQMFI